jgi:hypothetical protein
LVKNCSTERTAKTTFLNKVLSGFQRPSVGTVQYPKIKSECDFLKKKPSINIAGNCVWLLGQIWGARKKAKVRKKEKVVISHWPCLPPPPPPKKKYE